MTAPNTNLKKQERRHRWPLIGMAAVLIFAAVLGVIFLAGGGEEVVVPAGDDASPAPEGIVPATPGDPAPDAAPDVAPD